MVSKDPLFYLCFLFSFFLYSTQTDFSLLWRIFLLIYTLTRFPCEQCNYKGTTTGNLRRHIRFQHPTKDEILNSENGKYKCDQCEYTGRKLSTLKRHKVVLHEAVTYPCGQCEYAASNKSYLKAHKARKH